MMIGFAFLPNLLGAPLIADGTHTTTRTTVIIPEASLQAKTTTKVHLFCWRGSIKDYSK